MVSWKEAQAGGSMGGFAEGGWRVEVEVESKVGREGVRSALRFWIMLSSMVLRERRRKSVGEGGVRRWDCGGEKRGVEGRKYRGERAG